MGELSNTLQSRAPEAIIRIGDYPRNTKEIAFTVLLSKLTSVPKLENIFTRADYLLKKRAEIEDRANQKIEQFYDNTANIPTLDI